ncbi:FTR1_2 [Sanghuangporus weigelae]
MVGNLSSIPKFFIVFHETLEAATIISALLCLVEGLLSHRRNRGIFVTDWRHPNHPHHSAYLRGRGKANAEREKDATGGQPDESKDGTKRLIRRLGLQILFGSALELLIGLAISAGFIAIFFTKASELWAKTEELREGIPFLIASSLSRWTHNAEFVPRTSQMASAYCFSPSFYEYFF